MFRKLILQKVSTAQWILLANFPDILGIIGEAHTDCGQCRVGQGVHLVDHQHGVAELLDQLTLKFGCDLMSRQAGFIAALVHDVGRAADTPQGRLDDAERARFRLSHSIKTASYLRKRFHKLSSDSEQKLCFRMVCRLGLYHHYPYRVKDPGLRFLAYLLHFADKFRAICEARGNYDKPAQPPHVAIATMLDECSWSQYSADQDMCMDIIAAISELCQVQNPAVPAALIEQSKPEPPKKAMRAHA